MRVSRRNFLKSSLSSMACFAAASTVPAWVSKSAHALQKSLGGDRILVIVQQSGGNDGLNTVIPQQDDLYLGDTLRPNLHITSGLDATQLDELNALHPKLAQIKEWWDQGNVAVVQSVGYPNPNLSHFVATDYWELAVSPGSALASQQGWASRFFDNQCEGVPAGDIDALSMLAAGRSSLPLTLDRSALYIPPAVNTFDSYKFEVPGGAYGERILEAMSALNSESIADGEPALDFIQRTFSTAEASVEDMAAAAEVPVINPYPEDSLGVGLDMVSRVIRGGFGTRIFYVTQGGYDTHANQYQNSDPVNQGDHQRLLTDFDMALGAFMADMQEAGLLDKVLVLTFSEFGRRIRQNGSRGTDHGTGNCLFVLGGKVNGGIYGGQPDLTSPDYNLPHKIDFRSVYAKVIRDWFDANPEPVFGSQDYTAPQFNIQQGMEEIPFLDPAAPPHDPMDIDASGAVDAVDVQYVINGALDVDTGGINTDVNADNKTDATDIQSVINAVLGIK